MTVSERNKVLESLAHLLDEAPDYGEVGILCHLHAGIIDSIEQRHMDRFKLAKRENHG